MKKLSSIVFYTFFAAALSAQTPDNALLPARKITTPAATQVMDNGKPVIASPGPAASSSASRAVPCGQLAGPTNGANGNVGIAFSVVARQDIVITTLDNIFYADSQWVSLYYKKSGLRNTATLDFSEWTYIDSAYIENISTKPTRLPILINKQLNTADTISFLIFTAQGVQYGDGNALNNLSVQNTYVKTLEGIGVNSAGATFVSRIFNGNVNYCPPASQLCLQETAVRTGSNGQSGVMFDIKATKHITVNKVGTYVFTGTKDITLYTKQGTHIGFEADSTKWTRFNTVTFDTVKGADSLVYYTLSNPINIDSGKSVAFYVKTQNSGSVKYSGDATFMSYLYYSSGLFNLYPGTGVAGSFDNNFTPRIWNGGLDLCVRTWATAIGEAKRLELSLYPNPANDVLNITTDEHEPVTLDVIDLQGRAVMTASFLGSATLDVAQLSASVYQLYLHNANGTAVKRFVKN